MTPWGRILPSKEMRKRAGNMSAATEWRLAQKGEGPPRIKLSPQRWGYPENLFNEWLKSRFERPLPADSLRWAALDAQEEQVEHPKRAATKRTLKPAPSTATAA